MSANACILGASLMAQMVKIIHLQCRRPGFDPWLGRSPGERNGNPLQYSCLKNPMDRGSWRATVHGVTESDMTGQLSTQCLYFLGHEWTSLSAFTLLGKFNESHVTDEKIEIQRDQEARIPVPICLTSLAVFFFYPTGFFVCVCAHVHSCMHMCILLQTWHIYSLPS